MKIHETKAILEKDWNSTVEQVYGRPYILQKQLAKLHPTFVSIQVPSPIPKTFPGLEWITLERWVNEKDVSQKESVSKYKRWVSRFYPHISIIANDLYKKGILDEGSYLILIPIGQTITPNKTMKNLHKKIASILKSDNPQEVIVDMIVELLYTDKPYDSEVYVPSRLETKEQRAKFVKDNQQEYDTYLKEVVDRINDSNGWGASSIAFIYSFIKGQRMAPLVAESLRAKGHKVKFDKKSGRFVVHLL